MATSKAEIEKKLRRALQRRTNAEQEIDELSEKLAKATDYEEIRGKLSHVIRIAFASRQIIGPSHLDSVDDVDVKYNNVGPLGGLSTVIRGRVHINGGEHWFAINVYCDEESQDKLRSQVLGPPPQERILFDPYSTGDHY